MIMLRQYRDEKLWQVGQKMEESFIVSKHSRRSFLESQKYLIFVAAGLRWGILW